jgi:hypothetical protein
MELEQVMALLPQDKVRHVQGELNNIIRRGGPKEVKEEKTKLQKGLAIMSGKAVPSDFKKDE